MHLLDIDLYKDGFTHDEYTCMDIPVAAACGYFNRDNYFDFLYLMAVKSNFGFYSKDIKPNMVKENCEIPLSQLGFNINRVEIESKEAFFQYIEESIQQKKPVLMSIKYKGLFYDKFYQDKEGEMVHLLLISGWNPKIKILTIRDSSFFIGLDLNDNKVNVLFPLNLKQDYVWDIFYDSWFQSDDNNSKKYNYLYQIEQSQDIPEQNILHYLLLLEQSYQKYGSVLERRILSFDEKDKNMIFSFWQRQYAGNIAGIMMIIKRWLKRQEMDYISCSGMEEEYIANRKVVINSLYRTTLRGKLPSEEKKKELACKIRENDKMFFDYIHELIKEVKKQMDCIEYHKIPLESFYNNKAIGRSPSEETADISGTGIYYYFANNEYERALEKGKEKYFFSKNIAQRDVDNISCKGQVIPLEEGVYSKVLILGCSEYGSYKEKLKFYHNNTLIDETDFKVSDFYQLPIYGETIFCAGDTFQRDDDGLRQLNFNARIYMYEISVKNEVINQIQLPDRRNIHIFSMTLLSKK